MITDKNDICEMWAEHFEKLGTPSTNTNSDSAFLDRVSASAQKFVTSCKNDTLGDLNDPLTYEEAANACSKLKPGFRVFSLITNMYVLLDQHCGTSCSSSTMNFSTDLQFVNL